MVKANAPAIKYVRNRGTEAVPLALTINTEMGSFRYFGRHDSSQYRAGEFGVSASENWALATGLGIRFFINGTNNGDITRSNWLTIENGEFVMPYVYDAVVGATNRDLYIDDSGKIGYVSSSIKYKENIRDFTNDEISKIYQIPVQWFDYKDSTKGINQIGIIAENLINLFPELVSYKYLYEEIIKIDEETQERVLLKNPVLDENGDHKKEIETVLYSKIGLLALKAIQDINNRLKTLEGV